MCACVCVKVIRCCPSHTSVITATSGQLYYVCFYVAAGWRKYIVFPLMTWWSFCIKTRSGSSSSSSVACLLQLPRDTCKHNHNGQTCSFALIPIVSFETCMQIQHNLPFVFLFSPHVRCSPRLFSRPCAQGGFLPPADGIMLLETVRATDGRSREVTWEPETGRFIQGAPAVRRGDARWAAAAAADAELQAADTHGRSASTAVSKATCVGVEAQRNIKAISDRTGGAWVRFKNRRGSRTEGGTNLWWSELSASFQNSFLPADAPLSATPTTRMQPKMFREKLSKSPVYTHTLTHTHPSPPSLSSCAHTQTRASWFASETGLVRFSNVNRPVSLVSVLFFANRENFAFGYAWIFPARLNSQTPNLNVIIRLFCSE